MATRPFRFGVATARAGSRDAWISKARRIEELGYNILLVPDHFGDQLAPGLGALAAAEATTRLRVGTFVYDNDFRHPVVLAKEIATLDLLTEGRFEPGLGAGWHKPEYDQAGLPFDPPGIRVARLEESVQIVKGLLAEGPFRFKGAHYTVSELNGHPKPLQRPRPPILIGGGGRRMLSLAAREADIVGLAARVKADGSGLDVPDVAAEATDRKLGWLREAAGDRFDQLELNVLVFVTRLIDDRQQAIEALATQFAVRPEMIAESPHVMIGSVEQVRDDLLVRRARWGISYVTIFDDALEAFAPVVASLAGR